MSSRMTFQIRSECDVSVDHSEKGHVRIRIVEKDPNLADPTDLELEGMPEHILDAAATLAAVLSRLDEFSRQEPS